MHVCFCVPILSSHKERSPLHTTLNREPMKLLSEIGREIPSLNKEVPGECINRYWFYPKRKHMGKGDVCIRVGMWLADLVQGYLNKKAIFWT